VSDDREPIEVALDVLFYAPLGLALTAAEEMPKLAEKGRQRFASRWATARMVGQFAVAQGRKEAARRFTAVTEPPARPTAPAAEASAPDRPAPTAPATDRPAGAAGSGPSSNGAVPAVGDLAIPGYDSLSASQVVQRLAGLSASELDAVRRYESGTRGRRTILTRVAQLQGS
jgi:hypothetical protein